MKLDESLKFPGFSEMSLSPIEPITTTSVRPVSSLNYPVSRLAPIVTKVTRRNPLRTAANYKEKVRKSSTPWNTISRRPLVPQLYDADLIMKKAIRWPSLVSEASSRISVHSNGPRAIPVKYTRSEDPDPCQLAKDDHVLPVVRYRNYVPSFSHRTRSMENKKLSSRWLTDPEQKNVYRGMQRYVKDIVDQEANGRTKNQIWRQEEPFFLRELRGRSQSRNVDRNGRTKAAKIGQFRASQEEIVLTDSWCDDAAREAPSHNYISSAIIRPADPKDLLIVHANSIKDEMTENYMNDAMKSRLCSLVYKTDSEEAAAPTLFNVQLAKKDSLVVQFKSFLGSRDRTRMTETAESEERILPDGPERGPNLRLLIPKISGDIKNGLNLDDYQTVPYKTVQQMVDEALMVPPVPEKLMPQWSESDFLDSKERLEAASGKAKSLQSYGEETTKIVTINDRQTDSAGHPLHGHIPVHGHHEHHPPLSDDEPLAPLPTDSVLPVINGRRGSQTKSIGSDARRLSDSYRSSRRSSKAALESLLNLKVTSAAEKFQQRMSLILGKDIRFARDSELSEDDMLQLQQGRRVRFLIPGPEARHTYEQVELEGLESWTSDTQSDLELMASVDRNIDDIRAISARLETAIREYDPESYRSPNLEKMLDRKKSSLSPVSLIKKFQSFQQRKLVGTQLVLAERDNPPASEKKSRRLRKTRLSAAQSVESLIDLNQVLKTVPFVSKKRLMGVRKTDKVKAALIHSVRDKLRTRKLGCRPVDENAAKNELHVKMVDLSMSVRTVHIGGIIR